MPLVTVENLTFTYPDSQFAAVKDATFSVWPGEYIAILGANGSGKSTLARLLCGILEPSGGSVQLKDGIRTGIVFQSPDDQIVASIVERDTAFGPQNLHLGPLEVQERTRTCLQNVGLFEQREQKTATLSQGQKQKLAFAGITALYPQVLVLDEAASMLDPESRTSLLGFLDEWLDKNNAIVHITHDKDEALRAHRIIAMDDGHVLFDGTRESFCANLQLSQTIFGNPIASAPYISPTTECALCFDKITFSYPAENGDKSKTLFKDFSLAIPRGRLVALMGASGCGKSTLMEIAAGLLVPESGCVRCCGDVVLALQDSERALFEEFVADDVAFAVRNKGIVAGELVSRVRDAMNAVELPFEQFSERKTFSLSGGQKRKLSLAGIIAMDTPIILFDEPTAGLDQKSRNAVMAILLRLVAQGKTVLFTTHRQDEAKAAHHTIRLSSTWPSTVSMAEEATSLDTSQLETRPPRSGTGLLAFLRNCGGGFSAGSNKNAPIQSLPATMKYIVFLTLFITAFLTRTMSAATIAIVPVICYAALARYPVKKMLMSLLKIAPWILLFFVLQQLFLPVAADDTELLDLGFTTVTSGKLEAGGITMLHLLAAFVSIAVFVYSISEREVLDGLSVLLKPFSLCHIPVRHVVLVVGIVFRFVPILAEEAALIVKVQIIRGGLGDAKGFAAKIRAIIPLIVPLFIRTLKRADALADALTARHYS